MIQSKEYIEELLDRFLDGQTSEEEEQILADFFSHTDDIPEEWQDYKDMFDSFSTDAYDFSESEIDVMLTPSVEPKRRNVSFWRYISAACLAAVIALAVFVSEQYHESKDQSCMQNVSTTDLLAAIDVLSEISNDDISIKPSPDNKGFVVTTSGRNNQLVTFILKCSSDGRNFELVSQ